MVKVFWREPRFERGSPERPFGVRHRVPRGVTVPALDHHVLPEDALKSESKPLRRAPRRGVRRVAFPFEPAITEVVEGMTGQEEDRLRGRARALQGRGEPDMADLDPPVLWLDGAV